MPLINCKVFLELSWIEDCVLSSAGDSAKWAIADTKLHVPIVTFSTKDSANLTKQLNEGFKRSAYWNSYETKPAKVIEQGKTYTKNLYELLNISFQDVKKLFVLAYFIAEGGNDEAGKKKTIKRVFSQEEKLKITMY